MPKPPEKIDVRETLHHGDFRNVREVTIFPTWAGFVELLASSPYPMGRDAENNRYAARAFADLLTTGKASHGWSTFDVVASHE